MAVSDVVRATFSLFAGRKRRTWTTVERTHVEFRELGVRELAEFTDAVTERLSRAPGVRWYQVSAHLRRVVVGFDGALTTPEALAEVVAAAERAVSVERATFGDEACEHPADQEPSQRLALELLADALGVALGGALSLSIVPASNAAGRLAALTSVVRTTPRLRRPLDARIGEHRTDLLLGLITPLAHGLAQHPGAALVEGAHKASLLREARAREATWTRREGELFREAAPAELPRPEPRPVPLPDGPVEEYADRAWMVSLAGFAVSFLTTRSFQRAAAALYGGVPRPARMGRDVFAAELGRALAERGVLIVDPRALRRLDRVDTLVIQGALVAEGRVEIGECFVRSGGDVAELARVAASLFQPTRPTDVQQGDGVVLGPPRRLSAAMDDELAARAAALSAAGALVLGLARAGDVVGLCEVRLVPRTGIEEVIDAARRAELRVVVATGDQALIASVDADDVIADGDAMASGVRRLQREGRVVCVLAAGACTGLGAADVGIGLVRAGAALPWGAHLVAESDLAAVRFIVAGCGRAREVSKQSVNVALGAATLGALASAGGIVSITAGRVLAVVNAATLISMANGARGTRDLMHRALPLPRDRTPWHALDARGVVARLGSNAERGLTPGEAEHRIARLPKPRAALAALAEAVENELYSPLGPLLAAGAGLSAVVGSAADAAMLGGVVLLNAVVGGAQRLRAERAIRQLEQAEPRRVRVRRGGVTRELDTRSIVRGDVLVLGAGDVVPADCRLLECEALEVDASTLTGESLPVKKSASPSFDDAIADRASMLYEGTLIAAGRALALVVAVGDETEARRGIAIARRDRVPTGVETRLRELIGQTGPVALGAAGAVIAGGLVRGRKLEELVGSGVSLAVASVPEGLPLLATAAQLAAADRLRGRGALVRNPRAIEALGRVDVLCFDKTGTVTVGRVEVALLDDGSDECALEGLGAPRLRILAAAVRASGVPGRDGGPLDPTDVAVHRAAERLMVRADYGCDGWRMVSELSFESGRSYHAAIGATASGPRLAVKGAPEILLAACSAWEHAGREEALDDALRARLAERAAAMARRGLRVIAVAERKGEALDATSLSGLVLRGFLALSDPVRPSARAALARLRDAGVKAVMITGDHPSTARAIASELDLTERGRELSGVELARLSDDELDRELGDVAVFARVSPAQKVRIVRALQRAGRVVAMVGDGANDAPAIRLANVGIAIGDHAAVARASADVVLADERIETIADAVAEGRAVWSAVRDAVSILIGGNFGEIAFTVLAGLADGRPPLHPRQLLLVNLLTDVAPAMAIALRPPTREELADLASHGPEASLGGALNRDIAARAAVTALGAGGAWAVGKVTGTDVRARTMALVALVGTQLGQTLASGGLTAPVVLTSVGSAAFLGLVVQTPGLSQLFGCRPLGPVGLATAVGFSAAATGVGVAAPKLAERVYRAVVGRPAVPDSVPGELVR